MALPMDTCGDTFPPGTPGPGGHNTAFPSTCGSGLRRTSTRALGGTGGPLGKTFFLHCQMKHPELPKIPTYLPRPVCCAVSMAPWLLFTGVLARCVVLWVARIRQILHPLTAPWMFLQPLSQSLAYSGE